MNKGRGRGDKHKRERSRDELEKTDLDKGKFEDVTTNSVKPNRKDDNERGDDIKKQRFNKCWQVHFDETYKTNFYYNPYTEESLWELPEGAEIESRLEMATVKDTSSNSNTKDHQEIAHLLSKNSYQEIESIEESEWKDKMIWQQFKQNQLKEWMLRPARQQVQDTRKDTAYIEGNYDYNIWYDKYWTDRKEEKEKIAALYKCNPALDTGYTRADKQYQEGSSFFCLYFAKGCCSEGKNCRYYHRVPTWKEVENVENLRDIFGRSRFANAWKDNGGIGVFTKECRIWLVSDLKKVESKTPDKDMVKVIYQNFSDWGEIEDINYIPNKSCCYIRYAHRCFAEFAKEAMMRQSLIGDEIISIKWCYDEIDPITSKILQREEENKFVNVIKNRINNQITTTTSNVKENVIPGNSGYGIEENKDEATNNYVKLQQILQSVDEYNKDNN